jgi:hypothetical protein
MSTAPTPTSGTPDLGYAYRRALLRIDHLTDQLRIAHALLRGGQPGGSAPGVSDPGVSEPVAHSLPFRVYDDDE